MVSVVADQQEGAEKGVVESVIAFLVRSDDDAAAADDDEGCANCVASFKSQDKTDAVLKRAFDNKVNASYTHAIIMPFSQSLSICTGGSSL
jgi:hypothetical protein